MSRIEIADHLGFRGATKFQKELVVVPIYNFLTFHIRIVGNLSSGELEAAFPSLPM